MKSWLHFSGFFIKVGGKVVYSRGEKVVLTEYSTSIRCFVERSIVTLTEDITVGELVEGVTYQSTRPSGVVLPAGTRVATVLLHFYSSVAPRTATGWVEFGRDILGVVESAAQLAATDSAYGAPGITYRGVGLNANRQLENDALRRSGRRIDITFSTSGNNTDEMRIFLAA